MKNEDQVDTLGTIIGALGTEGALRFIELFAGTRQHVPTTITAKSKLTAAIGFEAATAICTAFGVGDINVPIARSWRIRTMREQGKSYGEIARALGITEGCVAFNLGTMGLTGKGAPVKARGKNWDRLYGDTPGKDRRKAPTRGPVSAAGKTVKK